MERNIALKKPKVLIIVARNDLGGPGKGILQIFDGDILEQFDLFLADFSLDYKKPGEFLTIAQARGISTIVFRQRTTYDPLLITQAINAVRRMGIDVIQTHGYKSDVLGFFIKLLLRRVWVSFFHGFTSEDRKVAFHNRIGVSLGIRFANRMVSVSESSRELLIRLGGVPERIEVIHNAIDIPEIGQEVCEASNQVKKNFNLEEYKVISVIGRLSPEKGHECFFKAFAALEAPQSQKLKVLIIGEGPERQKLINLAEELKISNCLLFLGHVPDVTPYYLLTDLIVIPSESEGLPNVLLESLAHGIPVVATSVGGIPEVIGNGSGGILVARNDYVAMARTIKKVLEDESLRKTLSISGKNIILKDFSVESRNRKILQLYNSLTRKETHWN